VTAVVHLVGSLSGGGTPRQAVQLVRLLQEDGRFDVTLACLNGEGPLREELRDGPGVLEYPISSLYGPSAARQLARFASDLRKRGAMIVQTHDVYANIFGLPAARLAGVPVRIAARRDIGGVTSTAKRRLERQLYRLADRVVTNAYAVGRDLAAQGVPATKIVTIHNAVDAGRVAPKLTRAEAIDLFGLPAERQLVVLVANLWHDVKDHPTFLRAARRVKQSAPASAFVVAGRGSLAAEQEALAARLGIGDDVFFVGLRAEIGDLLALADVCVLSSRAEGLGNVVLEYMAAGRPVVATDVGGVREAVIDGETGHLVAAGDDEAMAARIVSLLENPDGARRMGTRGRARAETHFSGAILRERTIALYESLLDRSGG
jgi:glycosyltransferase involved in cell wall biosynthesis